MASKILLLLMLLGAGLIAPSAASATDADATRLIMVPDLIRRGDITYPDPIPVNGPSSGLWKLSPDIVAEGAALELLRTRKGPVPAIQVAMIGGEKARAWYVGSEIDAAALVISRKMIDLLSDPAWRARALGLLAA